ncbi:hypothetical protein AFCDBAGC_5060 [Methylobacterium cerastii]|uniref:Twin-arginine translocation signal domain-containing protein n=1 Tax=Methylobacterium cerastii TaxID=932741 RepID=A0ABQ4QPL0_9HYPH|nr:hypothetical protein [Methylobacterium cerastii]GJD47174.1 hypothetical protein AFCDBAGC_5060 [Methylobacterium cerastii]
MSAPASRRGFLRGIALASATAGTGAFAIAALAQPEQLNPDAELLAASTEHDRLNAAFKAACAAYSAASRAARADHGVVPASLLLNDEDCRLFKRWHFGMPGDPPHPHFRPNPTVDGTWLNPSRAWSERGLRIVLDRAVAKLGPAGRTPHLLRRWRHLHPEAEAYGRAVSAARARHRTQELHRAERHAEAAWRAARVRIRDLPATTREGLAAQVRLFQDMHLDNLPEQFRPLLISAANVASVHLNLSEGA